VTLETNSIDNLDPAGEGATEGVAAAEVAASEADAAAGTSVAESAGEPQPTADTGSPAGQAAEALLTEISATLQEVADQSRRYHTRAEQREAVIDFLRSELDVLRRGERRGLLRPVLADLCRLRGDLLTQAAALPTDFDAAKAADLLRSYAETIELTLESNGVITYVPDDGERFDPRLHRRVGGAPSADPALAGHIAGVRRDGYLDIEANSPIAPAEVTVFGPPKAAEGEQ
jgi:molecular chaperone GrpE